MGRESVPYNESKCDAALRKKLRAPTVVDKSVNLKFGTSSNAGMAEGRAQEVRR